MPLKKITKIIIINILILIILVIFLEICSGFLRIFYGKILPFLSYIDLNNPEISKPYHPCNEMKTDVLLSL